MEMIPMENKRVVPPAVKQSQEELVRPLDESRRNPSQNTRVVIGGVYLLLVLLGVGTGYLLSQKATLPGSTSQKPGFIKTDTVVGSTDTKTFRDSAVGVVQKGGVNGEGTHQLIREGGPSQTVYLISSVVDLDQYVGKKVKVFGETVAAQKAAWLMDVGKVELQ